MMALVAMSVVLDASGMPLPDPEPAPPAPALPAPDPEDEPGAKSPGVATALSVAGTLVPIIVAASAASQPFSTAGNTIVLAAGLGTLLGPSLGHWYAGDYLTAGLGMRLGGTAVMAVGFSEMLGCILTEAGSCNSGTAPVLLGAGLFVGGTVYDIATAGSAAHRWNTQHLQLAPTATTIATSNGHQVMGVGLGGRF